MDEAQSFGVRLFRANHAGPGSVTA
jgi:hypothetical protein